MDEKQLLETAGVESEDWDKTPASIRKLLLESSEKVNQNSQNFRNPHLQNSHYLAELDEDHHIKEFKEKSKVFFIELSSLIIDSLFLAIWVVIQWAVNEHIIKGFGSSFRGIDHWSLKFFQYFFAASTLSLVISYGITDLITIGVKTMKRIKKAIQSENSR